MLPISFRSRMLFGFGGFTIGAIIGTTIGIVISDANISDGNLDSLYSHYSVGQTILLGGFMGGIVVLALSESILCCIPNRFFEREHPHQILSDHERELSIVPVPAQTLTVPLASEPILPATPLINVINELPSERIFVRRVSV